MANESLHDQERQLCELIKAGEPYSITIRDQDYKAAAVLLQVLQEKLRESSK